jgi:cell wall-associated NlpC family hydrolase
MSLSVQTTWSLPNPATLPTKLMTTNKTPNKSVETNCRPASPLDAGRQFGRAVHALACVSGGSRSALRSSITSMRAIASILLLLTVCGCSPSTRSGDFGHFLISEIDRLGGRRQATNDLPVLTARWTVQSDANGFEVHLPDTSFTEVAAFLRKAYGEPYRAGTNDEGRDWMLYRALDIGVAIHFYSEEIGCAMNCVRAFKSVEEMFNNIGGQ